MAEDDAPLLHASPAYLDAMLELWRRDPAGVDRQWHDLFVRLGETPSAAPTASRANGHADDDATVHAYRARGHLVADADPLGLANGARHPDLDGDGAPDLVARLRAAYCGTLSAEFMHMDDPAPRTFLAQAMEEGFGAPDGEACRLILDRLIQAETFEQVMQVKFPTAKRFGMEGSETQLPLVETLLAQAAGLGVEEVIVGPMHRGRTTFMATVMAKPLQAVFAEFRGRPWHPDGLDIPGDVTYHMGHSTDRDIGGRTVHLSMASHPSHVETAIAVALGRVRARQAALGDAARNRVLGLMMHTDAGFAGQGIVAECFQLSGLRGYATGGSIHVVANNQVGFTTDPRDARTSRYCTDMAKIVQAPVLRVNGDDPEAAHRAAVIAVAFWHRFHRDIVIDLVCYRRQGHNELDEPRYTQGPMYAAIDARPTVTALYGDALEARGLVDGGWIAERSALHRERFASAHDASGTYRPNAPQRFTRQWSGFRIHRHGDGEKTPPTGVDPDTLKRLGAGLHAVPEGVGLHPNLVRQLAQRAAAIADGRDISWASAELLAFASLLDDGTSVRLTGEDTRRGTFSQRHAVLVDRATGAEHVPLAALARRGARVEIHDTPLGEEAVLGFEYGHTIADPHTLVAWEAQFGDFANVAQTFIDNYLANGEDKWLISSGLVLLLPHGLEGGGPEHSSARPERFLQLCARDNMNVVNCTTPANHFHVLRRQMKRDYRKPLVAMTPKLMLRHRAAVSALKDFGPRTRFRPVLSDVPGARSRRRVARIVLCSGRIWFALDEARRAAGRDDIALVRIEELYPFPAEDLARLLAPHAGAEIVWCQEEPRNMGAWSFVDRRLEDALKQAGRKRPSVRYAGRPEATVPAAATRAAYEREQRAVIEAAIDP